jgi:hypothetical protein
LNSTITENAPSSALENFSVNQHAARTADARSTINQTENGTARSIFHRFPLDRINWLTSSFLMGTLALTLTAVPLYLWRFGLDWFQVGLFLALSAATGLSITV